MDREQLAPELPTLDEEGRVICPCCQSLLGWGSTYLTDVLEFPPYRLYWKSVPGYGLNILLYCEEPLCPIIRCLSLEGRDAP